MKKTRTVSALLYTNRFEVLLHEHNKYGVYLGPGGHVEDNEHESDALLREVYEETGITLDVFINKLDYQRNRLLSPDQTVEIVLDSGGEVLYDHVYFIQASQKIRQQQLKTESDNKMNWYDIRVVLNDPKSFPLYNDTRYQLLEIYNKVNNHNHYKVKS